MKIPIFVSRAIKNNDGFAIKILCRYWARLFSKMQEAGVTSYWLSCV